MPVSVVRRMDRQYIVLFLLLLVVLLLTVSHLLLEQAYRGPLYKPVGLARFEQNKDGRPTSKSFAYYTQTPSCVPEGLLLNSCLGNSSVLDFYVLSFRKRCDREKEHDHVFYVFNQSFTWTQGRNHLYRHVRKLRRKYQYHIFLDDDSRLLLTEDLIQFAKKYNLPDGTMQFNHAFFSRPDGFNTISAPSSDRSPWRVFEQELIKHSPAFANVAYCSRRTGIQGRVIQTENMKRMCGVSPLPDVTVMFNYDALFIAFHDKALDILFPMYEGYEQQSWWISDQIQFHTARVLLRGSGITVWKASVFNLAHSNYPRGGKMDWERWKVFLANHGRLINELSRPHFKLIDNLDDNALFSDPSICGKPIKYPVHEHYHGIYGSPEM